VLIHAKGTPPLSCLPSTTLGYTSPDDDWPRFTEDDVNQYAKRLGNLVLLRASDNSLLKSKGFAAKQPVYAASPYVLTSQVAELPDWTVASIIEWQKQLAELAVATWPTT
jgi:hypothetical protein